MRCCITSTSRARWTWALAQTVLWPDLNEQTPLAPQSVGQGPANDSPPQPGRKRIADTAGQADRAALYRDVLRNVSAESYDDWIGVGLALEGSVRQGVHP